MTTCLLAVWRLLHFSVSLEWALALASSECGSLSTGELVPAVRTVVLPLHWTIQQSRKNY